MSSDDLIDWQGSGLLPSRELKVKECKSSIAELCREILFSRERWNFLVCCEKVFFLIELITRFSFLSIHCDWQGRVWWSLSSVTSIYFSLLRRERRFFFLIYSDKLNQMIWEQQEAFSLNIFDTTNAWIEWFGFRITGLELGWIAVVARIILLVFLHDRARSRGVSN